MPKHVVYVRRGGLYLCLRGVTYFSPRFKKSITVPPGYVSDGASGPARDIDSLAWWVHDVACERGTWDNGQRITEIELSVVLHDILQSEGRWIRGITWPTATIAFRFLRWVVRRLLWVGGPIPS